jgi:DNA repair exonuclease SbcCD nuclease subunit
MAGIRFIHTADLHLDTPFKGLSNWNSDLASRLKDATFNSFKRIIELCVSEDVDFLVISGDIFDSQIKSLSAQLKFAGELKKLSDLGIPTYFICGNHDPLNSWLDTLEMPKNVIRYDGRKVEHFTFMKNDKPLVDIYGISFKNKTVNKNLAKEYQRGENASPISIALLHGTIGTQSLHENYAPFSMNDIVNKGFDYWALGHIHKREIIKGSDPAVVYPGNPQGRDFGETGAKGCYLIELDENKPPNIKFLPTQLIRFEEIRIDITGENKINRLPEMFQESISSLEDYDENTSYILRGSIIGRTILHSELNKPGEIETLISDLNEGQLDQSTFTWIDKIILETKPEINEQRIKEGSDFSADLLKLIDGYEHDTKKLTALFNLIDENFSSASAKRELSELSDEERSKILERSKWMLLDQLIQEK